VKIKFYKMATGEVDKKYLSDEFLDWETRDEAVPFWKHVIAGKHFTSINCRLRVLCWNRGALQYVPHGYD